MLLSLTIERSEIGTTVLPAPLLSSRSWLESPAALGILTFSWNVLDLPGAIDCDAGASESAEPKSWVSICQLTFPENAPSRRKMIPVQVPPTGWATSTSPWLPSPCGRV